MAIIFKRLFWPVLCVLLAAGWCLTLLLGGGGACDERCMPMCRALDITYEVNGLPLLMSDGRNILRRSPFSQEAVLTEITRVPVRGELGEHKYAAAVLMEQTPGGMEVNHFVAAVLPDGHGGVYGTNALPLGDRIQILDVKLMDGVIWISILKHAPGQDRTGPPTVPDTVQICCYKGRLYFPSESPVH